MTAIVLVDEDWGIGRAGHQIVYIPGDLKYFRETTMGHAVILGRKTLTTFPGGRPLKGRRNLILSRDPAFAPEGAEVFSSLDALLVAAPKDAFVIGGASVYAALLDRCDTVYVTKVQGAFSADCHFPDLDAHTEWGAAEEGAIQEEGGIQSRRSIYRKRSLTGLGL